MPGQSDAAFPLYEKGFCGEKVQRPLDALRSPFGAPQRNNGKLEAVMLPVSTGLPPGWVICNIDSFVPPCIAVDLAV